MRGALLLALILSSGALAPAAGRDAKALDDSLSGKALGDASKCPQAFDAAYADMHDGDKKQVNVSGPTVVILPSGNNQSWEVDSVLNPPSCWMAVDFRVPGKPGPPPVSLNAVLWTSFGVLPSGQLSKKAVWEFTDPTGTLAPPGFPLNHWVQLGEEGESKMPVGATACAKMTSSVAEATYADMHDGDKKTVSISESSMSIVPSGDSQSWVVNTTLDTYFCNASVDFRVPGKPSPPPVALTATFWSSMALGAGGPVWKTFIEFTDPSGTLAPADFPLNQWVQLGVSSALDS